MKIKVEFDDSTRIVTCPDPAEFCGRLESLATCPSSCNFQGACLFDNTCACEAAFTGESCDTDSTIISILSPAPASPVSSPVGGERRLVVCKMNGESDGHSLVHRMGSK